MMCFDKFLFSRWRYMVTIYVFVFTVVLPLAAPDWTNCPAPCQCTWSNGKKAALCKNSGFNEIPHNLESEIQVLDLSGNFLSKIPPAAFQSAGFLNLHKAVLSGVGLIEIHRDAFKGLAILVEIDLSNNNITSLDPETFQNNENLRFIQLSGNPLRQLVRAQFPLLPHLRALQLEGCHLEIIDKDSFINLPALETINLKNNILKNISKATFTYSNHLRTIALDGNPWNCDCNLRVFRNWFIANQFDSVSLICSEPKSLSGRKWKDVPSEEFACIPQVFAYPQQLVQAEVGGDLSFGCHVLGDPETQVSWLYEGHIINHTGLDIEVEVGVSDKWANITIHNLTETDVGLYTCVAKNILETTSVNVSVVLPEIATATTSSNSEKKGCTGVTPSA